MEHSSQPLGHDGFEIVTKITNAVFFPSDPLTYTTLFSIEKDGVRIRLESHDPVEGDRLDEGGHLIPFDEFDRLIDWLKHKNVIQ